GGALRHVVSTGAIAGARLAGVAPVAVGATETRRAFDLVRTRAIAATHRLGVVIDAVAAVRSAGVAAAVAAAKFAGGLLLAGSIELAAHFGNVVLALGSVRNAGVAIQRDIIAADVAHGLNPLAVQRADADDAGGEAGPAV